MSTCSNTSTAPIAGISLKTHQAIPLQACKAELAILPQKWQHLRYQKSKSKRFCSELHPEHDSFFDFFAQFAGEIVSA